jgi:hypothetical protein
MNVKQVADYESMNDTCELINAGPLANGREHATAELPDIIRKRIPLDS